MKKVTILFLKVVILLIATVTFLWIVKFPQLEGRASHLDLISIYTDPFIIFGFIASIPFFVGLYQVFKLLNFLDAHQVFSQGAVSTLKNLKIACLSLIGFIAVGVLYIRFVAAGDDPAGPIMLGFLVSCIVAGIAITATIFQKHLQGKVKK